MPTIYRSWGRHTVGPSIKPVYVTGASQISSFPALLTFIVATHSGTSSGAKVEIGDGSTVVLHLESSSGDVSPFGISLSRPIDFGTSLQLSATATGLKCTLGFYELTT